MHKQFFIQRIRYCGLMDVSVHFTIQEAHDYRTRFHASDTYHIHTYSPPAHLIPQYEAIANRNRDRLI